MGLLVKPGIPGRFVIHCSVRAQENPAEQMDPHEKPMFCAIGQQGITTRRRITHYDEPTVCSLGGPFTPPVLAGEGVTVLGSF